MAVVIAALLPVFLLIVLGFILKRTLIQPETQWHGLERLTYYVLFPMLLVQTLVKADLTKVPVAGVGGALMISALLIQTLVKADLSQVPIGGVGGALFLSALAMSLLCLALRPLLARFSVDGPAFTSIFQGATRWQTYVALAVSGNLFGDLGLALASVAMRAEESSTRLRAETAAFDGVHLREFKYNNPGTCLRGHGFSQFERGFTLHNPALALNYRQFADVLNGYIQHDFLPALVL